MNLPVLILLYFWKILAFDEHDVRELRRLMREGSENKNSADELFRKVGEYNGQEGLILAYKASAFGLRAKHSGNPVKKLKSIKASSKIFSQAVARDDVNLEIRFMRYAVEINTPKALDLSKHLNEDKALLMEGFRLYPNSSFDEETVRIARDFMQQNCHCSEEEKETLRKVKI